MSVKAYAQAGVDIALAETLLKRLKPTLKKASRPEVLGGIGSFGGLFDISKVECRHPILVSSTDSVGTKLKVANLANRHAGVGADIVHHCMNDIAVMGATPLFFLDYFACDKLRPEVYQEVLKSVANACRKARCALIGGETCELPGVYVAGEYDLVGTIVGVVPRRRILTGEAIREGDLVLGLRSSGLHTNGYSLARRICFEKAGLSPEDVIPGTRTRLGDALLKPHLDYATALQALCTEFNRGKHSSRRRGNALFGAAHITGGGITGNLPRILPREVDAIVRTRRWRPSALFRFLVERGGVDLDESYEVWNMGIGLCLVVAPEAADPILRRVTELGHRGCVVGEIVAGTGCVRLEHRP